MSVPIHQVEVEILHCLNENLDLLLKLDIRSKDQYYCNLSKGEHEYLHQISWQSIEQVLRSFTLIKKCQTLSGSR